MSQAAAVRTEVPFVGGEGPEAPRREDPQVVIFHISGAFFFGAAASIGSVLDRINDTHRALVLDMAEVPFLDSTGANVIEGLARKAARQGIRLYVAGARPGVARALAALAREHGLVQTPDVDAALADWRGVAATDASAAPAMPQPRAGG